ncbi:MAG: hypothetical protein IRY88_00605 [Rubrobacteraceae bacterium]|nr:hypothetical protein [Rubrobacteraceae bacterium]
MIRRLRHAPGPGETGSLRVARADVLGSLSSGECIFCRREGESVGRFFFWYLHEGYSQPENVERLRRSGGFCPAHTSFLIQQAVPQTVASIYLPLISAAAEDLRGEGGAFSLEAPCPACTAARRGRENLLRSLAPSLRDGEVRGALRRSRPLCLPHLLWLAPALSWDELAFVVGVMLDEIQEGMRTDSLSTPLWGSPHPGESPPPEATPATSGTPGRGWSPAVAELRFDLSRPGCPVCRAEEEGLGRYLSWLSREVAEHPHHRWEEALGLCGEHGRAFGELSEASGRLLTELASRWQEKLGALGDALREERPPEGFLPRLARLPTLFGSLRRESAALPALRQALVRSFEPRKKVLQRLRGPVLQRSPCPACRSAKTAGRSKADLLWRALSDPETRRTYEESDGLCLRHLPPTLSLCEDGAAKEVLSGTARSRMLILQWELREYQRRQSWNARYERKGPEQDAWRRAVAACSGITGEVKP